MPLSGANFTPEQLRPPTPGSVRLSARLSKKSRKSYLQLHTTGGYAGRRGDESTVKEEPMDDEDEEDIENEDWLPESPGS